MKNLMFVWVAISVLCGCAALGSFPSLEKSKTTKEDVRSLLGEPAEEFFIEDRQVWRYQFLKEDMKTGVSIETIMTVDITFKENAVDDYKVIVSQRPVQEKALRGGEALPPQSPEGSIPPKGDFIKDFDRNNDARVSSEEFPGPDEAFNRLDRNNDGYIDEGEAPEGPPPQRRIGRDFIEQFDSDNDSRVSSEEFPGPDKAFYLLDRNDDGYVDKEEAHKGP